jgi:hypothetical protein
MHLIDIYRHNDTMIPLVAVRPKVIVGQPYLSSPQAEPSIFWENMRSCSKNYPFSTGLKLRSKEIFTKGKTGRAISYRDSRLSANEQDPPFKFSRPIICILTVDSTLRSRPETRHSVQVFTTWKPTRPFNIVR